MTDLITTPVHTTGAVEDYFYIEGHLLSTRNADAYKGIDRGTKASVCLWKLRNPLPVNSDSVRQFISRLTEIGQIDPPICDLTTYGVDASGIAFAVFPNLHGVPLLEDKADLSEAERRFLATLRYVEALHSRGIVCGDICGNSFWTDRGGETQFIGVMGAFDGQGKVPPPQDTLRYLAPEQRAGGRVIPATDVFALGIIGYFLLTGRFPYEEHSSGVLEERDFARIKPPSSFSRSMPGWADEVILKCLEINSDSRYPDAGSVSKAITEIRQRITREAENPIRYKQEPGADTGRKINSSSVHAPVRMSAPKPAPEVEQEAPADEGRSRSKIAIFGLMGVVFILTLVIGVKLTTRDEEQAPSKLAGDLKTHLPAVESEGIKQAIVDLSDPKAAAAVKAQQLEKIISSDDPLSHAILVQMAVDAATPQEKEVAEKAVLDRAHRLGLKRSSEQVRQWLRSAPKTVDRSGYTAVLKSLDTTLPTSAHEGFLKEAYPSNPHIILKLAAALALDRNALDEYKTILTQLSSDILGTDEVVNRSAVTIILATPELALAFGDDVIAKKDQIPDEDLLWLLKALANRGDGHVKEIAQIAVERKLFSRLRQVYISPVTSRPNLATDVLNALIRAAAGVAKKDDLTIFGRWYDPDSAKVMLALCADDYDKDFLTEAFEIVAGKSLTVEPAGTFVSWVRRDHWDKRGDFAHAIGVLGNLDSFDGPEIKKAIAAFDRFTSDPHVIDTLVESGNPELLKVLLAEYSRALGVPTLLKLLSFPHNDIKIGAMKGLESTKDIGALKLILDAYEREKDPEIKKAYEEKFWVVRQRIGKE